MVRAFIKRWFCAGFHRCRDRDHLYRKRYGGNGEQQQYGELVHGHKTDAKGDDKRCVGVGQKTDDQQWRGAEQDLDEGFFEESRGIPIHHSIEVSYWLSWKKPSREGFFFALKPKR